MMLAKIALSAATFAIDRPYSYRVPAQLENLLEPGMRVLVPFGKGNRSSEGLVLSLEQAEETHRLKEIQTLLDRRPVLTPEGIQLALWMRERFFCTVYAAALTILPTRLWYVLKEGYALAPGVDRETWEAKTAGHPRARQVMTLLHGAGGRADLAQTRDIPAGKDPRGVLRELEKAGLVVRETQARRKVKDKTEQIASLAVDPAEALARMEPRRKTAPMGYEVTSLLCNLGSASVKELCYFTGASHQTVKSLEKRGILRLQEREVFRHQLPDIRQTQPLSPLNEAQQAAYEGLRALMNGGKPEAALLYGVTGSGKTQVYLHLIEQTLAAGRGAIVMVPEIALTPSLLQLFLTHFGRQVAVLHSCLSTGERYDEWKRVRDGQASVVIGTRSAVFAPLADVGLMILDEEQESSYQSESMVRYHAREVAKFRCAHHKGLLLLGSATPAVESRYAAEMGQYHLFTLRQRYNAHQMPKVRLVDMKQELRQGNATGLSGLLREELEENLRRGEQPYGGMQPVRRGSHLSPVLGSFDLSQRQWQADVPLLRPFPAPAGALPPLLWPAPVCGHGHPKTPGGAGGELSRGGDHADGRGHHYSHPIPRGAAGPVSVEAGPHPFGHPDGGQGVGLCQCDPGGGGGRRSVPIRRQLPGRGAHLFPADPGGGPGGAGRKAGAGCDSDLDPGQRCDQPGCPPGLRYVLRGRAGDAPDAPVPPLSGPVSDYPFRSGGDPGSPGLRSDPA